MSTQTDKLTLQKMAAILRESDKPVTQFELADRLCVDMHTVETYAEKLDLYLEDDERIIVTSVNGETAYSIVNSKDKYPSNKTEGGYSDPTAAAAMKNYESTTKDWKYKVGDIWYSENAKHQLDPFLIIVAYSEKALLLRVYDESDMAANKIDLNDPNFVVDIERRLAVDTSYICTKPYKWLVNKDVRKFDDISMDVIRVKIAKSMHITDMVLGEEYKRVQAQLDVADASIEELSKTVDRLNEEKKALKERMNTMFGNEATHNLSEPVEKRFLEMQLKMVTAERDRLYNLLCGVCDYDV